jgi:hypothetical protein
VNLVVDKVRVLEVIHITTERGFQRVAAATVIERRMRRIQTAADELYLMFVSVAPSRPGSRSDAEFFARGARAAPEPDRVHTGGKAEGFNTI